MIGLLKELFERVPKDSSIAKVIEYCIVLLLLIGIIVGIMKGVKTAYNTLLSLLSWLKSRSIIRKMVNMKGIILKYMSKKQTYMYVKFFTMMNERKSFYVVLLKNCMN